VSSEIRPEATTRTTPGGLTGRSPEAWLGADLRAVVAAARRRASRDADRQVDTAHLLHSLLESDPAARQALDHATAGRAGAVVHGRAARVLAYLAQRPIGYGMRWRGAVEETGAPTPPPAPVSVASGPNSPQPAGLQPAAQSPSDFSPSGQSLPDSDQLTHSPSGVRTSGQSPAGLRPRAERPSDLSPAAVAALGEAVARAGTRGESATPGTELLRALAADSTCRAAQVLRAAGVDPKRLSVTQAAGPVARIRYDGQAAI
jgi:hypothetical protein